MLRSKAHWGYDSAQIEAFKQELTLSSKDLDQCYSIVAVRNDKVVGFARVHTVALARLHDLYVEPEILGRGIGGNLFNLCVEAARRKGALDLTIDADPHTQEFYKRMGCLLDGEVPSSSIPGLHLPKMRMVLLG